ncbi:hypothetical protein M413DRAFT_419909 [Hebeloma cylindrosporum]|uniref:DUF6533 domain-containing protein n=1 Tax=Hebeloma cylindrosporum TaxID=76867 RepID=A0A0C3C3S4_HEBCY|nr:hypothetical protein M413DRAFT_419909 [Hebeloma cylindrosporum h7]
MAPHPKAVMFMRFAISYSTIVLLWYDYALTWTREVKYFWTRRFTLSTATYIMCRCDAGYRICAILSVIGRVGIVNACPIRFVYWSERKGPVSGSLLCIANSQLTIATRSLLFNKLSRAPDLLSIVTAAYEILSALFTTARTVQTVRVGGPWWVQRKSLTFLILREGSLLRSRYCVWFPNCLSGQMTARFLIHLREWDDRMSNPETNRWKARTEGGGTNGQIRFKESSIPSTLSLNLTAVLGDDPLLRPLEASEVGRGGDISEEREVGSEGEA